MKKMLLILTLILILPQWSSAQSFGSGNKLWLSAFFELQEQKMKVEESIKQFDLKIAQNEQEIRQINELLAKIQRAMIAGTEKEKQDAQQAKPHAEEALMKARQTQKKLKEQKIQYEWLMTKIQKEDRELRYLHDKITTNHSIAGLVKECSGKVKIINLQTKKLEDACSSNMPINEGDEITTSSDGRIKLKILDGRGNFIIGPDSAVLVKRKSTDEEGFELIKGKVHTKVEKSDEMAKKINEHIQNYKEDFKTIKGWMDEKIEEFKKEIAKFGRKLRFEICTKGIGRCNANPEYAIGARGTEFTVEREGANTIKISVIEGSVEFSDNIKNKSDFIPEGHEAIINLGETLTKRKIENLERWWEK